MPKSKNDSGVRQLKNGFWAYRFSISVGGRAFNQRGSTDLDGNILRTKQDAIKARKKAIKMAQLAPLLPEKKPEPIKRTMRDVFKEYREKGCSDRAYATIRKQDSLWKNHLDAAHLDAAFGDRIIDEIPTADVVDYLAKQEQVTMVFHNRMLDTVIDQFGKEVWLSKVDDWHFQVTVTVAVSPQFFAWVFGLGNYVTITAPDNVVKQMKEMLGKVSKRYE